MLRGKRALIVGVANARSIAWEVADRWHREGAEVFVTYQVGWLGSKKRTPSDAVVVVVLRGVGIMFAMYAHVMREVLFVDSCNLL